MWPFQTTRRNLVFAEFDPGGRLYHLPFRITTDAKVRDSFGCSDRGVQDPESRVQGKKQDHLDLWRAVFCLCKDFIGSILWDMSLERSAGELPDFQESPLPGSRLTHSNAQEVRQRQQNVCKDEQRPKFWLKSEGTRKHTRLRSRHRCPGKSTEILSEQAGMGLGRAWRTRKASAGISSAKETLGKMLACCWMVQGTWWQRTQKRLTSFTSVSTSKAFRNSRPLESVWKFKERKFYPW